mmetsp:Transcript_117742/g.379969  ORF Transcript_117742/g.379969 Transcript_117742/m.379969 type:complete len:299 (+) Transcript_117742:555-1451(+)
MIVDLGALIAGERPRDHLHATPAELGQGAEALQGLHDTHINLAGCSLPPLGEPGVIQRGSSREAGAGVDVQQALRETASLLGDAPPLPRLQRVLSGGDVAYHHAVGAREGHVATEEYEVDDTQAPEVALACVALLQHLGRNVGDRAKAAFYFRECIAPLAEAEVNQLQELAALLVEEKVFQLQVSVHDAVAVEVVQREQDLPDHVRRVLLGQVAALRDAVEELAAIQALHDEVQLPPGFVYVVQPHYVWVVHGEEILYLGPQLLQPVPRYCTQAQRLHGIPLLGVAPARGQTHCSSVA